MFTTNGTQAPGTKYTLSIYTNPVLSGKASGGGNPEAGILYGLNLYTKSKMCAPGPTCSTNSSNSSFLVGPIVGSVEGDEVGDDVGDIVGLCCKKYDSNIRK